MIGHDGRTASITLPKDRSGLKERWINASQEQLNALEAEFIFFAQKKYLLSNVPSPLKWFNIPFLRKIHKNMLGGIWEWAGKIRTSEKNIGIKAFLIQTQLLDLCEDVVFWNSQQTDYTILEQACLIHHRLATIHPFEDGNGRFSRLVSDRYLKSFKCAYPIWPDNLHQDNEVRNRYISSLREADEGDFTPLIAFAQEHGARDLSSSRARCV